MSQNITTAKIPPAFISAVDWHAKIAEAAYFIAEHRGFRGGSQLEDWLMAEREIRQKYSTLIQSTRIAFVLLNQEDKRP